MFVLFDFRKLFVLFVLLALALVLMARANSHGQAIYDPGASLHPQGDSRFPRGDCGDNYFLFIRLPGEVCLDRGDGANKVESEMERIDPTIKDTPVGPEQHLNWRLIMYQALQNLGWPLP